MNSYNGFSPAQRMRGLTYLKGEYAKGTRQPPVMCDACGQIEGVLERHSEDYSEPFGPHIGAFGLCFTCHMMVHCRFRAPDAWNHYRQQIAAGVTFPPFMSRNWPVFSRQYLSLPLPAIGSSRAPPARLILDEIEFGNHGPPAEANRAAQAGRHVERHSAPQ